MVVNVLRKFAFDQVKTAAIYHPTEIVECDGLESTSLSIDTSPLIIAHGD